VGSGVGSGASFGVGSGVGTGVASLVGLKVESGGTLLGLTLDIIVLGLSVGLLVLSWLVGAMLELSLTIAGEGQIAQYGPTSTETGSEVSSHIVPTKVSQKIAEIGNLVRQLQRSWLKLLAFVNIPSSDVNLVTSHPDRSELKLDSKNIKSAASRDATFQFAKSWLKSLYANF
jgi:hypothetical protein